MNIIRWLSLYVCDKWLLFLTVGTICQLSTFDCLILTIFIGKLGIQFLVVYILLGWLKTDFVYAVASNVAGAEKRGTGRLVSCFGYVNISKTRYIQLTAI